MAKKLEFEHLNKILEANKKLKALTKKYYQGAKIQKISSEVLTMSLESGLAGVESDWNKLNPDRLLLNEFITKAEKRTNTTLRPEVKKILVEIEFLKKDKLYSEQLDTFEEEILPQTEVKDPFYEWNSLRINRARIFIIAQNRCHFNIKFKWSLFNDNRSFLFIKFSRKRTRIKTMSYLMGHCCHYFHFWIFEHLRANDKSMSCRIICRIWKTALCR